MDNECETIFNRLMNERNELRKYIIDICELLDINTSQSVLGANCLEFYAVLSSVANEKIKALQTQLKRKEEECEELHSRTASIIYSLTGGRLSYSTYTLEGCEQAYRDQLEIDVERATKELQEELQAKEQECEELKKKLQAQRDFTAHEQKLIYCVAYDKTCETGNECKQKKCVFKDRLKYKQALDKIRQYRVCEINDVDGEEDDVILGIISEVMEP